MATIFTERYRTAVAICLLILLVAILIHPFLDIRHGRVTRVIAWKHLTLPSPVHALMFFTTYAHPVRAEESRLHKGIGFDVFSPLLC